MWLVQGQCRARRRIRRRPVVTSCPAVVKRRSRSRRGSQSLAVPVSANIGIFPVGQLPGPPACFGPRGTDRPQSFLSGGCEGVDEAGDVGSEATCPNTAGSAAACRHRPGSPRPARPPVRRPGGSSPDHGRPGICATVPAPRISPSRGRFYGPSPPAGPSQPARPPGGRLPGHGHAGTTR